MKPKPRNRYDSFSYLEQGVDFPFYPLAEASPTVTGLYQVLNVEEKERVNRIFAQCLIVSMRDHGFIMPQNREDILDYCRDGFTAYSYQGLAESGLNALFDNFMDGIMTITSKSGMKWDDVIWNLGMRYCDFSYQNKAVIAKSLKEIVQAKKQRKVAVIPSLEAATALENEIDRVDILYGFGIRCMGITYNEANTLGSGLSEEKDGGLTLFGKRVVQRMNRLGMAIDISHCGDETSMDVLRLSQQPVLITHAGARALWNTPRMKSDDILRACKETGGVIGILAAPNTTLTKKYPTHNLDAIMAHFEYIVDLVGIDHVGFGPDTFYGDHVALQHAVDAKLSIGKSHSGERFDESSCVDGVENPTEAMRNIVSWLVRHGYADDDIAKVTGGNVIRALQQIWH